MLLAKQCHTEDDTSREQENEHLKQDIISLSKDSELESYGLNMGNVVRYMKIYMLTNLIC